MAAVAPWGSVVLLFGGSAVMSLFELPLPAASAAGLASAATAMLLLDSSLGSGRALVVATIGALVIAALITISEAAPRDSLWWTPSMAIPIGMVGGYLQGRRVMLAGIAQARFPSMVLFALWPLIMAIAYWREDSVVHTVQGLAIGFLLGLLARVLRPPLTEAENVEPPSLDEGLVRVAEWLESFRLGPARRLLAQLERSHPHNIAVMQSAYAAWKFHPTSAEFHQAAARLLDRREEDAPTNRFVDKYYRDYLAVTQGRPELPMRLHLAIAKRYVYMGDPDTAARIANTYLQRQQYHDRLPETLLAVAGGYERAGKMSRALHFAETIRALFPEADAAHGASSMLKRHA